MSQFSPEGDKLTLANFFTGVSKNVYPVGRLDYDSEGLLLLTDDKQLTNTLLNPSFAHPRTYLVQVDGNISLEALKQLQQGVSINIEGKTYRTLPAIAHKIEQPPAAIQERDPPIRYRKDIPTSWLSLTLTEGKNSQVRKMTAATGYPTLRLIRYAIGNLTIDNILPGTYKLYDHNIKELLFTSALLKNNMLIPQKK